MRVALTVLLGAATVYIGAMWVARYQLQERVSGLREDAKGVCMNRGTELPTSDELRDRVAQLGPAHELTLSDIDVAIVPIDNDHDSAGGAQVQAKLGELGALHMSGTIARVRAHVSAKKWLWTSAEDIAASCTLTRELQRTLPPSVQEQLEPGAASDTAARNQANQIREQAGAALNQ